MTSPDPTQIDRVARAMYIADCLVDPAWDAEPISVRNYFRDQARAAIAAMEPNVAEAAEAMRIAADWIDQCPFENAIPHAAHLRRLAAALNQGATDAI